MTTSSISEFHVVPVLFNDDHDIYYLLLATNKSITHKRYN